MAKTGVIPLRITNGMKCLSCISKYVDAENKGEEELPEIQDAITLAPSWQSQTVMGQVMMACVAIPSCMACLNVKEKTAEEKATEGGIFLGRQGHRPNGS